MNKLYQEISKELIDALFSYMNDEITIEELREADAREKILHSYNKWDKLKKELKENIFQCTKNLYEEINILERDLKHLDKICEPKEIDLDLEGVLAHAHILGRNRMPPAQQVGSNWYVEPFPTLQMVPSLQEENNELNYDSINESDSNLRDNVDCSPNNKIKCDSIKELDSAKEFNVNNFEYNANKSSKDVECDSSKDVECDSSKDVECNSSKDVECDSSYEE